MYKRQAKHFGVKVEEFGIGYPPRIFGKRFGETLYSINLIPLGAFVRIYGEESDIHDSRSFSNLAIFKRVLIVLGGVIAFWVATIVIFSVVFVIGASLPIGDQDIAGVTDPRVTITMVQADSPAATTGLQFGDVIKEMQEGNEKIAVLKIGDFQKFTQDNKDKKVLVTINREGREIVFSVTPRLSYPADQGPLGVELERIADVIKKYPWYEAPVRGTLYTGEVTIEAMKGIYKVLVDVFGGRGLPKEAQLAGPIGITIFLARAADFGVGFFLYFIGSISVLISLFNLLPIPALDGGKLLFLLVEKIKKRPVSVRLEQRITIVCFFILIALSLFVTVEFDIPRVVDFWKSSL